MQLQGATELESRISQLVQRCEAEMPASELETTIVQTLSQAGNELQRMRGAWPPSDSEPSKKIMLAGELRQLLNEHVGYDDNRLCVALSGEGVIGGTPKEGIERVSFGFDWNRGTVLLMPVRPLARKK